MDWKWVGIDGKECATTTCINSIPTCQPDLSKQKKDSGWDLGMRFGDVGCDRKSFAINSTKFPAHLIENQSSSIGIDETSIYWSYSDPILTLFLPILIQWYTNKKRYIWLWLDPHVWWVSKLVSQRVGRTSIPLDSAMYLSRLRQSCHDWSIFIIVKDNSCLKLMPWPSIQETITIPAFFNANQILDSAISDSDLFWPILIYSDPRYCFLHRWPRQILCTSSAAAWRSSANSRTSRSKTQAPLKQKNVHRKRAVQIVSGFNGKALVSDIRYWYQEFDIGIRYSESGIGSGAGRSILKALANSEDNNIFRV